MLHTSVNSRGSVKWPVSLFDAWQIFKPLSRRSFVETWTVEYRPSSSLFSATCVVRSIGAHWATR